MKSKLGVIGGMGSEATSYYFEQLVNHTYALVDQDYIDTIILNHATLPDRTNAILNKDTHILLEQLIDDIKILEQIGVKNIAIPCNTAHYFYNDLQKITNVNIINMIRETIEYILKNFKNVKKVGIMGTDGTIESGVYTKECEKMSLETVIPSKEGQKDIMSLIYEDIKAGKTGEYSKFQRTYNGLMSSGCDVIILACTELSVFGKKHELPSNCIDAMDILVKQSIIRSKGKYTNL